MTDQKVTDLTLATLPLSGDEEVYLVQGAADRRLAVSEIGACWPPIPTGQVLDAATLAVGTTAGTVTNGVTVTARLFVLPFTAKGTFRTIRAGVQVVIAGTSGSRWRLAVYDSDGALIVETAEGALDATGLQLVDLDHTFLKGRLYYLGVRFSVSGASVKIAPRNSHDPNSRLTRLVCLPCQPRPAEAASGFSITGAVSTKTLTCAPLAAANRPAICFSLPLMMSW
jgi:hypothetical protein